MTSLGRRTFLSTAASAVVVGATARPSIAGPYQTRSRIALPSGVQSGDVTPSSAGNGLTWLS